jgi:hypothetical protein
MAGRIVAIPNVNQKAPEKISCSEASSWDAFLTRRSGKSGNLILQSIVRLIIFGSIYTTHCKNKHSKCYTVTYKKAK